MASPFSLEGRIKLDARDFTQGAQKAKKAVGEIGDEFGKLPKDADTAAGKARKNVETEIGKLPKAAKSAVGEMGAEFDRLPKDADSAAGKARKNVGSEFDKMESDASGSIGDIGDEFAELPREAGTAAKKARGEVGDELDGISADSGGIGKIAGGNMGGAMIAGFGALGVGAVMLSSMMEGLETQRMVAKVNNAFRRTPEEAATQGKIAGDMYSNMWGESLGDLENKIAMTNQRIAGLTTIELQRITTGVEAVSTTWDTEFDGVLRSAAQLLENDLADSAEHALDIITSGFQDGADEAGDWLDTIDEYSQHFGAVGLSAEDMYSIITHGLQNGQRDADKMADAIKEMRLRITGESEEVEAAFEGIGLQSEYTIQAFEEGGDKGRRAYQRILEGIMSIEDPNERTNTAVLLIGTQYEDLGPKALETLSAIADGTEDVIDRNDELIDGINNQATEWDTLERRAESALAGIGGFLATTANDWIDWGDAYFGAVSGAGEATGDFVRGVFGMTDANAEAEKSWNEATMAANAFDTTLLDGIGTYADVRQHLEDLGHTQDEVTLIGRKWNQEQIASNEYAQKAVTSNDRYVESLKQRYEATQDSTDATDDDTEATEEQVAALEAAEEALDAARDALMDKVDAQRRSADAAINARAAERDLTEALDEASTAMNEGELSASELAEMNDRLTLTAASNADAQVRLAEDLAAAKGETVDAAAKSDIWANAMIDAAAAADEELRPAILDYIGSVEGIPAATLTEIQAAIDRGDIDEAHRIFDELDNPLDKWVNIRYNLPPQPRVGISQYAGGTNFARGGLALVGEEGPELVDMPRGAKVYTADETRGMISPQPFTTPTRAGGGASSTTLAADVRVFIGDRELTDIVGVEINQHDQRLAGRIAAGTRG